MKVVKLVRQAKKGDKQALMELIMAEKDAYYRLAYTYMENSHDAMDALEDMIVILYEKIDQLKSEHAFYSWSKTILVNRCKGMLRQQNKLVLGEEGIELADRQLQAESRDPYHGSDRHMDMQGMLSTLNEQQKESIILKYFHDLDYATIAHITGVPVGTVKSRVFQALKKLRTEYQYGGEQHG